MSNKKRGVKRKRGETSFNENICLFVDIETTKKEYTNDEKVYLRHEVDNWLLENPEINKKEINQKFDLLLKNGFQEVYLLNLLIGNVKTGEVIKSIFWGGLPITKPSIDYPVEYNFSTNPILSFIEFLKHSKMDDKEYIIYCHNLGYEFTFINRELHGNGLTSKTSLDDYGFPKGKCVFIKAHQPIQIIFDELPSYTFKDSLALFSKSIKSLGNNLELPKLPYNYDIYREPGKPLEPHDFLYNQRDNEIVFFSLYQQFFKNNNKQLLSKIPLTSTGLTRQNLFENYKQANHLRTTVNDKYFSIRNYEFYRFIRRSYTGGLATTNPTLLGHFNKISLAVDYTSSYPYEMMSKYFPMFVDGELVEKSYQELLTKYEHGELKKPPKMPYLPCQYAFHLKGVEANDYYQKHLKGYNYEQLGCLVDYREVDARTRNIDNVKGYFAQVNFRGLKIKNKDFLLLLSKHKIHSIQNHDIKELINFIDTLNGKIASSSNEVFITLNVSNVQLDNILMLYNYEELIVNDLYCARHEKLLPKQQAHYICTLFVEKDKLKEQIKKMESTPNYDKNELKELQMEYKLIKQYINAIYGIKVEDEVKDVYQLIEGEIIHHTLYSEGINSKEIFNHKVERETIEMESNNPQMLKHHLHIYTQGIFITDYARNHLIRDMVNFYEHGFLTITCDTDSLKLTPKEGMFTDEKDMIKHFEEIVNTHNERIRKNWKDNHHMQNFIHENKLTTKEIDSLYQLGMMDIESKQNGQTHSYDGFISLGAKKYAYIDDNGIHITVAGCSKDVGEYLTQYAKENDIPYEDVLKFFFQPGTKVSENLSGRTIARYETLPTDLIKRLNKYQQSGGIVIDDTSYFLNITENDELFLSLTIEQDEQIKKEQIKRVFDGTLNEDKIVDLIFREED